MTCCAPVAGSSFVGWSADTPDRLAITEIATNPTINQKKRKTGSGNLLPLRSTQPKNPPMPCWASLVDVFMVCSPDAESRDSTRHVLFDLHRQCTCVAFHCQLRHPHNEFFGAGVQHVALLLAHVFIGRSGPCVLP